MFPQFEFMTKALDSGLLDLLKQGNVREEPRRAMEETLCTSQDEPWRVLEFYSGIGGMVF